MKCAYTTTVLEQDGVPFGIELSSGRRTEHEIGIGRMVDFLQMRAHADGQRIACTRRLARRLFFARSLLDGEDHAILELMPEYAADAPAPSGRTLRRHVDALARLWSTLDDAHANRKSPVRGAWDEASFVVHARGAGNADALELLGGAFAAEDLSVTYGVALSLQMHGLDEAQTRLGTSACLGLFAPGLCPPSWRRLLAQASHARSTGLAD
jgi:hypothetical protein